MLGKMTTVITRSPSWVWMIAYMPFMMTLIKKRVFLWSTASMAQRYTADPAPSCLAAADWGGHPHFCPARDRHPWVHGRHPATGRLEVNQRHMENMHMCPWDSQHMCDDGLWAGALALQQELRAWGLSLGVGIQQLIYCHGALSGIPWATRVHNEKKFSPRLL